MTDNENWIKLLYSKWAPVCYENNEVYYRKLKERIAQLDSENTALTQAHVEK